MDENGRATRLRKRHYNKTTNVNNEALRGERRKCILRQKTHGVSFTLLLRRLVQGETNQVVESLFHFNAFKPINYFNELSLTHQNSLPVRKSGWV